VVACAGHIVLVPGGGPFADAVRDAQPRMGFDDRAGHHMALLAMAQYGCALAGLGAGRAPGFVLAASAAEIAEVVRARGVPVWSPLPMALQSDDLPASWDVTSDSLAVWLARVLGAKRVVLVKQIAADQDRACAADLVARGILDRFLPGLLGADGPEAYIVGPSDHAATAAAICAGTSTGTRVE